FALGVAETRLADSYNVANNLPNIVYELILGGILTSVAVPLFVEQIKTRRQDEGWEAARAVMTVSLVLLTAVMVLGIVAAPWIVRLYTLRVDPRDQAEVQALATFLLRFFMPQILLYGMGSVATSLLNAHRRFAVPMFAPVLNNIVVIASMLLFASLPTPGPGLPAADNISMAQKLILGVGTTAGVAAMTFALWPSLRRIGFRWGWALRFRHEAVRKLIRLSGWAVAYVAMNQVGLLFVIILAGGRQGGYTAYTAAFIFFQLPYAIFSVSIMTALLPSLSEHWVRGDRDSFRQTLARGVRASAFVVVPAAAGYVVLARPIVRLLLEHGVATTASTRLVASVLVFFSLGLFSFSAFLLFLRAFYAMQDTRTPALVNVGAVGVNIGANFALFPFLGVRGLALGHAIAYTFAAVVAGVILRRRLGGLEGRRLGSGLGRIGVAAAATGAAAWGAARAVGAAVGVETLAGQLAQVASGVSAGLIVFVGAAVLFRMEELDLIGRTVLARFRR
ncbi:MAG TPA: murein biosynthesis integral membrane protein MurJ, partial [Actinomycetota bacterium]|nr:murein biosynthesis integral membrane protein MurJ [Actinomycetota bacterium]